MYLLCTETSILQDSTIMAYLTLERDAYESHNNLKRLGYC